MDLMTLRGICLIASVWLFVISGQACLVREVQKCPNYRMIAMPDFHAYIPEQILDEICRGFQRALTCAYTEGKLDKCRSSIYKLPFDTQRGVINAVCVDRREEYLRSSQCFNKKDVQPRIARQCLTTLTNLRLLSRDPCGTIKGIVDCSRTNILMTDGCDDVDAALMADVVEIYLQPSKDQFECPALSSKDDGTNKVKVTNEVPEKDATNASMRTKTSREPLLTENAEVHKSLDAGQTSRVEITQKKESPRTMTQTFSRYVGVNTELPQTATLTVTEEIHADENVSAKTASAEEYAVVHKSTEAVFVTPTSTDHSASIRRGETESWLTENSMKQFDLIYLLNASRHISVPSTSSATSKADQPAGRDWTIVWTLKPTWAGHELKDMPRTSEFSNHKAANSARFVTQLNRNIGTKVRALKSTYGASNIATITPNQAWLLRVTVFLAFWWG